jgi:hypothetical protein
MVAVKVYSSTSTLATEAAMEERISTLTLHHKNLVAFKGWVGSSDLLLFLVLPSRMAGLSSWFARRFVRIRQSSQIYGRQSAGTPRVFRRTQKFEGYYSSQSTATVASSKPCWMAAASGH